MVSGFGGEILVTSMCMLAERVHLFRGQTSAPPVIELLWDCCFYDCGKKAREIIESSKEPIGSNRRGARASCLTLGLHDLVKVAVLVLFPMQLMLLNHGTTTERRPMCHSNHDFFWKCQ